MRPPPCAAPIDGDPLLADGGDGGFDKFVSGFLKLGSMNSPPSLLVLVRRRTAVTAEFPYNLLSTCLADRGCSTATRQNQRDRRFW